MESPTDVVQPAITFLNMTGDITITWYAANEERIKALVEQKMAEGFSFFVLTPRLLPIFGKKKAKLTSAHQLNKAVGVVVPDDQAAAIVGHLGDAEVDAVVRSGAARVAPAPAGRKHDTVRRASSANEVLNSQTVAVRPLVGG